MKRLILAILIVGVVSPAMGRIQTSGFTGNQLLNWCEATTGEAMFCQFYITGVADGLVIGRIPNNQVICRPPNSTNRQLQDIVKKFLQDNPTQRNSSATVLIFTALREAFPCQ
jgi:hypothetical protein